MPRLLCTGAKGAKHFATFSSEDDEDEEVHYALRRVTKSLCTIYKYFVVDNEQGISNCAEIWEDNNTEWVEGGARVLVRSM